VSGIYVYIHTHIAHTHTRTRTRAHTHIAHAYTHRSHAHTSLTRTHTHAHIHTHAHAHTHTYTRKHTRKHTHTHIHTHAHTYAHIHTHTHIHTYTFTHTYAHARTHTLLTTRTHTGMAINTTLSPNHNTTIDKDHIKIGATTAITRVIAHYTTSTSAATMVVAAVPATITKLPTQQPFRLLLPPHWPMFPQTRQFHIVVLPHIPVYPFSIFGARLVLYPQAHAALTSAHIPFPPPRIQSDHAPISPSLSLRCCQRPVSASHLNHRSPLSFHPCAVTHDACIHPSAGTHAQRRRRMALYGCGTHGPTPAVLRSPLQTTWARRRGPESGLAPSA